MYTHTQHTQAVVIKGKGRHPYAAASDGVSLT